MTKEHYYCNKCKRNHYKGSKIFKEHMISSNVPKNNKPLKILRLIREHNELSKKYKESKRKQSEKIKKHSAGMYSEVRVKEYLDEQSRILHKQMQIQSELKKLGYKQKGL